MDLEQIFSPEFSRIRMYKELANNTIISLNSDSNSDANAKLAWNNYLSFLIYKENNIQLTAKMPVPEPPKKYGDGSWTYQNIDTSIFK